MGIKNVFKKVIQEGIDLYDAAVIEGAKKGASKNLDSIASKIDDIEMLEGGSYKDYKKIVKEEKRAAKSVSRDTRRTIKEARKLENNKNYNTAINNINEKATQTVVDVNRLKQIMDDDFIGPRRPTGRLRNAMHYVTATDSNFIGPLRAEEAALVGRNPLEVAKAQNTLIKQELENIDDIQRIAENISRTAVDEDNGIGAFVEEHPHVSVGIAVGGGILLGSMLDDDDYE